jgi:hypothetical protein
VSVHFGETAILVPSTEQQLIDFLLSVGDLAFSLFNRGAIWLSGCCHSGEPWAILQHGMQAFWFLQSSRLLLRGGAAIPALRQER